MTEIQVLAKGKGVLAFLLIFWFVIAILHFGFTLDLSEVMPPNSIAIGIGLSVLFLLIGFFSKETVRWDSDGCSIEKIDFWGLREDGDYFRWNEVTETTFTSYSTSETSMIFEVKANGQTHQLFSDTSKNFGNKIKFVNEATPHLPYIWGTERSLKTIEKLEAIEKIEYLYKVPRR